MPEKENLPGERREPGRTQGATPAAHRQKRVSSSAFRPGKGEDQALKRAKERAANSPERAETSVSAEREPVPQKRHPARKTMETVQPEVINRRPERVYPGAKVPLRIIPLGGLGEIGKNMTVYECENDAIIVDCGMTFPDDDMPGIDIVIPDFMYLTKIYDKIRGLVITHGHEDHIGGIPYLLKFKDLKIPAIYGTKLTLGILTGKLKEHGLVKKANLIEKKPGDVIQLGCFSVELIHVNHSIPDAVALAIKSPAGMVIQTGDFKIDPTPIDDDMIDLARFADLGRQGVLALLSDSTNVERPGYTMSERKVGESFATLFKQAEDKRIIVASFSSNIHRIQQIVDEAVRRGRKVAVSGRSMINVVTMAVELGYLKVPTGVLIDIEMIHRYPPEKLVIVTTGSQGEPMSALYRMAFSDHRQVEVGPGDFIIISATPIPGNEKTVFRVVNELMKLGAEVVYEKMYEVHVSGHACQEEQKLMLGLVNPQFFIPVHGEQRHLMKHVKLAQAMGMNPKNTLVTSIGKVIEFSGNTMKEVGTVPSGRVLVDGLGIGDVGSVVLRDRKHLSEDGLIVISVTIEAETGEIMAGPDLVSRGFVYIRAAEQLLDNARTLVCRVLDDYRESGGRDWAQLKNRIQNELSRFIYEQTKRSPMILPVIMEV